jgi:hypothetical protein
LKNDTRAAGDAGNASKADWCKRHCHASLKYEKSQMINNLEYQKRLEASSILHVVGQTNIH